MCSIETNLCRNLINDYFGKIVADVANYLCCNSWQPLRFIILETKLKADQIRKSLCVLIQHKLVKFQVHKQHVQYKADAKAILNLLFYPRMIYTTKLLYGDIAELIVEEILQHGMALMSVVIGRVTERLQNSEQDDSVYGKVEKAFTELVKSHFFQREPDVETNAEGDRPSPLIPNFIVDENNTYHVPKLSKDGLKRKRTEDGADEPKAKRFKEKDGKIATDNFEDDGVYWSVNVSRFYQYFRDQAIVLAIAKKHGVVCGEIVRAMLRISEVTTPAHALTTQVVAAAEIARSLPTNHSISVEHINQHLRLLSNSTDKIVELSEDSSAGGSYVINLKNAALALATASILSYVQERFGSKAARIFRLLMIKKHLEQKHVEQFAMIPSKEAKECLYNMFTENVVVMQEIPRTPDHAPSRTFYLYSVNLTRIAKMLLVRSCKAISNLITRQKHVRLTNKRLLDKQERMAAIKESLQDADDEQLEEIEEMMTSAERAQLTKYEHSTNKLHNAQLQISETVLICNSHIQYALMPPPSLA